jgi:predicted nucleotidyltransferase/predicted transcriptional regulator
MPLARVTVTIPAEVLKAADRLARRLGTSRSAVMARALGAHLAAERAVESRVAERGSAGYAVGRVSLPALSDDALLGELRRRLGAPGAPAGRAGPSPLLVAGAVLRYDRAKLAELCRKHGIRKLSLFGSVVSDDFGPDSDVDLLVEFEPGRTPGLAIADIEDELSALFGGRRVDLVTERSLHPLIRERVLATALVQYAP